MKECFKCKIDQPLSNFYKHPEMSDGHVNKCKECNKADVKGNYAKRRDYYRDYDKKRQKFSINRILTHRYNSLVGRVNTEYAASKKHNYTAKGMPYLSKKDFMVWADENMDDFMKLYSEWRDKDYSRKYVPSIDRIDNNKGYTADNMQWLTLSDNCQKPKINKGDK